MPRRRKTDFDPASDERLAEIRRLERQLAALQALQEAARSLTSDLDLDQLLARTLEIAVEVMQASAGSLLLFDPTTNELVFRVVQGGKGQALVNQRFPCDQGIAGSVFTRRRPAIVDDVAEDARFLPIGQGPEFSTNSLIAVPLIYKGDPIGVVEVLNQKTGERFSQDDQDLLLAFAAQSAVAIENARLYHQVVAERDRILLIEEEVRHELARELHDGPSQFLSAMIMNLRFLREVIARKPARAVDEVENVENLATQALHQIRSMLFNLRPVLLETQGLGPALQAYVDRQRENRDLAIHLEMDSSSPRLNGRAEAAIFSIVQEAVGNVRKHAAAQNLWIKLHHRNGNLIVVVKDDGCGFDPQDVEITYAQRGSMGLLNMKERAQVANAKLTIQSQSGLGTTIRLDAPLDVSPALA